MFWTIFFIILFVGGIIALSIIISRKWNQLRLIDPSSLPDAQTKKMKNDLLRQRLERGALKYAKRAQKDVFKPLGGALQVAVRKFAGKLTAAERKYQQQKRKQATRTGDTRVIDQLIDESQKFMDEEIWDQAEKRLIQAIGLDSRNVIAYELLGRVYLYSKDLVSAKETFEYLKKITPEDPSVIASLGEVAQKLGNKEEAVEYFEKALNLRPKNPKYLDFYIESVIKLGDVHRAMTALDQLAQTNPDNKKILEFEKKIEELREQNKKK